MKPCAPSDKVSAIHNVCIFEYFYHALCNSQVNQLSQSVLGETVFSNYRPPSQFTGELFGIRYLYNQTGRSFTAINEDKLDTQIDEGFGDVDDLEESSIAVAIDQDEHPVTVAPPADPESDENDVIHVYVYNIVYTYFCILTTNLTLRCALK